MKLVVPSSGSMIQVCSESPAFPAEAPDSSARIACVSLACYRQQVHVARGAIDDRAGSPRGPDRDSEHRVHFFVRELKRAALLNAGF